MTVKRQLFTLKYGCYRKDAFDLLRRLDVSQYAGPAERAEATEAGKRQLVRHAMAHNAFYARHYTACGLEAGDIGASEGWFERLPVLTKEHVRNGFQELLDPRVDPRHIGVSTTGGSTGVPTRFAHDKRYPVEAFSWRMMQWWGIHPWDDGAYVWRNPRTSSASLFNRLLWWPTRKFRLDASSMDAASMEAFLLQLEKNKPPLLQGYVGAVDELARFVVKRGRLDYAPRAIWLTSAPILPAQRSGIERAFNAPVYDQYGCCEVSNIAAQCECRQALHVNTEAVHVEFVMEENRSVATGEWGKTLLTKFNEQAFPLIRYEVGDMGRYVPGACPCGRTLPLMDGVKGRTTDIIRLPSGRVLSGEYLTTIFDAYPDAVSGFRVTQKKDGHLLVEYVAGCSPDGDAIIGKVKAILEAKVQGEVPIRFQSVAALPHDRGKLRFVVRET